MPAKVISDNTVQQYLRHGCLLPVQTGSGGGHIVYNTVCFVSWQSGGRQVQGKDRFLTNGGVSFTALGGATVIEKVSL